VVHPEAAGIDVGSEEHWVAVPEGRGPVRRFAAFTGDLLQLAAWLKSCGVNTVAMESTGVYWIPLFQILEAAGFEVCLVNTKHLRNVPGRKSDVLDCQWLQQMHSFGLLGASFRPKDEICVLRSYLRHRDTLVKDSTVQVERMQKALTQMNLLLHNVISDITGITGMRILRAIIAGERDTLTLARMKHPRIQSNEDTIAKSLRGDYRTEHLFTLRQALELYDTYRAKIDDCDREIERQLQSIQSHADFDASHVPASRPHKKGEPHGDFRPGLYRVSGVDLTQIDGIKVNTVLVLLSEIGPDLSRFPTEKHFCSWLGLCPNPQISGGRRHGDRSRRVVNRAAQALRIAAQTLRKSQSALGAYFRRLFPRLGAAKTIKAVAHKLARLVYRLLTRSIPYADEGPAAYEARFRSQQIRSLSRRATALGLHLIDPSEGGTPEEVS
jgi:transposase